MWATIPFGTGTRVATKVLLSLIIAFLVVLALARILNGAQGAVLPSSGAWDFHTYWYNGQYVEPNSNWAYPLNKGDGLNESVERASAQMKVEPPSLTPPLFMVLSIFSYLPWPLAKLLWTVINVILVLATPWLVLKLLPLKPTIPIQILIMSLFWGMSGISIAIRAGQLSILVFFLMLLTLVLVDRGKKVLPGIILGLALSKFWLSFPVLLFLIYKRRWKVAVIGLGIQIFGLLGFALLVQSPIQLLYSNFRVIANSHINESYINLIHLAGHFKPIDIGVTYIAFTQIGAVVSLLLFGVIGWLFWRYTVRTPSPALSDYTLFAVLNLWGLLVAVHNQYDIGPSILAIALLISAISHSSLWGLRSGHVIALKGLIAVSSIGVVGIPALSQTFLLPVWAPIRWRLMTIGIMILMLACLWLWRQGLARSEGESQKLPSSRESAS